MKAASVPTARSVLQPPPGALRLMSDERLARWAARGSQAAFAVIFERHHRALHRYCHSIVGNAHDAADALQGTMLSALRALPGETREIALKPWLYRIAHNESISLLRARRGDSELDSAAHVGDPAADGIVESRERLRHLTDDLRELSEQQRGALLMRELGGLAFKEIAAALQIGESAARQSAYEARCALQDLEAGRAMACEAVRRALSDSDRRSLRGLKLRGHLRACAGCREFEAALHQRPAQLAALAPPLPLAAAASMLHGLLGAGGGHGGGGLLASLGGGTKGIGGTTLAAKVATVAVVGGTIAGGAAVAVPALDGAPPQRVPAPAAAARAAAPRMSAPQQPARAAETARAGAAKTAAARRRSADRKKRGGTGDTAQTTATAAPARSLPGQARRTPSAAPAARRAVAARAMRRAHRTRPARRASAKPAIRPAAPAAAATPVAAPAPAMGSAATAPPAAPVSAAGSGAAGAGSGAGAAGSAPSRR